jgi:aminomethyltransferase
MGTRKTQLYENYKDTATLVEFAGFEMPLYFGGIASEHLAVRNNAGVFDVSHMGRVRITGTDSERFLNYLVTNDVSKLAPNSAQYSVMCNESGGIMDDFVVYRLETERFLVVFNAGNRQKDYDWLLQNAESFDTEVEDVSDSVAMLAVQGPMAFRILQKIATGNLVEIERFKCASMSLGGVKVSLARTGYTGEDGFEVFIWEASMAKPDSAVRLWNSILEAGRAYGIEPCGLGARDTLRLEAGLCLYGNDIDESITPFEAGLGFVVKLQKGDFLGKDILQRQKNEGVKRRRIGIVMMEQGIPRPGFSILNEKKEQIGSVTSGTFSPLLRCGIGMGYVETSQSGEGNIVIIEIRKRKVKARIASFPLYDPEKYGYRRKIGT